MCSILLATAPIAAVGAPAYGRRRSMAELSDTDFRVTVNSLSCLPGGD